MIGFQDATSASLPCCTVEHAGQAKWARFFEGKTRTETEAAIRENVPIRTALSDGGELDLDAVDTVDAVDEEDQDEDEGDLQAILQLCDYGILGDEAE